MGQQISIALHNHSRWSYDGFWSLKGLARFFGTLGYDAVMMTEHDTGFDPDAFAAYRAECAAASTVRCRIIPGIEYSSPDNRIHILTWGLESFLAEHRPVVETLERVAEAGGATIFSHPVRHDAWEAFDPAWVPQLSGIEIWNRKSDGIVPGSRALALMTETGLAPTVGCDFHRLRNFYPLSNRMEGAAGEISETALVTALKEGRLKPHASGTPLLDAAGQVCPLDRHHVAERFRRRAVRLIRR